MISHPFKFIYSHIPKCAGTTIEVALKKHASPSLGNKLAKENKWWRNKRLFELYSENPSYYKFSFTRNPFERIVSAFTFFTNNNISFKNFVLEIELFLDHNPQNIFKEVGYFDESLPVCEDYDLWLKICSQEKILFINQKLTLKYGNVSYDDRDLGMGRKIKDSELIGIPWSIIIGKKYEESKQLEITNRSNGEKLFLTESEVESFKFEQYAP